jgi:galactokinase
MTSAVRAPGLHRQAYGDEPTLMWAAPGRVNLIGEHTDYNDGFVLPFALPHRTTAAVSAQSGSPAGSPVWTVVSESMTEPHEGRVRVGAPITFGVADLEPGRVSGWAGYIAGTVWALRSAGVDVPGARIAITSDVPVGSGLSSSAALECAVLAAMLELSGGDLPREQWPAVAQRVENGFVGVPTGIMDQSASTLCQAGHALFLDCRTGGITQVPLALEQAGLAVLIIDTRAPHQHAGGEYAQRRATCEAAAHALGVPALRDVTDLDAALAALPDDLSRRRVRHVVTENARVHQTVALLESGQPEAIGPVLTASHASLRDDYEVTVAELDVAVDSAVAAGALGARMTGGGFGGCAIALVPTSRATEVADAVAKTYAARGFAPPVTFTAIAGPGAHRVA